ncbi:hypothetical protein BJ322DRAFT_1043107 [Thelephora terrestris]|uniref:Uncharacterized protein n=1 Tax=Thelephora terrestris TaxID=56493 RepID=A0A9P6HKS8_9AGAM|nr:hypothetical protein BJ322DRAFT_1043107 [Thelephora terrestris]
MSAIRDAIMGKPFDFEAAMAEWKNPGPPVFKGVGKKDPIVDAWLDDIKAQCTERKIPKDFWHLVGQRSLGSKAKARFTEVDQVMMKMHDGKYKWNWKKFKVAMKNMGWDMDPKKVEAYKVASKPSGVWWIIGKEKSDSESDPATTPDPKRVQPKRRQTTDVKPLPPTPTRRATEFTVTTTPKRRGSVMSVSSVSSTPSQAVTPNQTPGGTVTTVTNVPTWLLNATSALDFMTTEHPKVMTTLSAILITVGTLPAIPALAGGAGGAFLASHAVQAAGAIAVGLGNLLKAAQDNAAQRQPIDGGATIEPM